jgi:UbiD family decarboxylase
LSFSDLRTFLAHLEKQGDLVRVKTEVDPNQEVTIIQHRVMAQQGPALLFENIKGSPYRLVSNLFGTKKRVDLAFCLPPAELGQRLSGMVHELMPPTLKNAFAARSNVLRVLRARMKKQRTGPILDRIQKPDLNQLPCLTCWPKDGGAFFTLPLVHSVDPETGVGNLGIYRLQRYDATSTGMHWQIEKGGGFHFKKATHMKRPLPISVILGGPPALTIAAIAALPEGLDERIVAALLMNKALKVVTRNTTGHRIPADAEFVLEGSVSDGDLRQEGPFGDHLGHYSHSANFPVFRVDRLLARKDAIFPATVVGKPPQEDFFIGLALQEFSIPLLKVIKPGICDLWAYPESGFHPLAVMSVHERYPREALKQAFSVLGEGQLSLTKVIMVVDANVPVKNFEKVSQALWENLDPEDGLHLISPTAQDTLDFTGPAMNTGSRLILLATQRNERPLRTEAPKTIPKADEIDPGISRINTLGPAFLIVQLKENCDKDRIQKALASHPKSQAYLFHVLVSSDVDIEDPMMVLWGWFTRFDPLADLHPAKRRLEGNRIVFSFPIAIDARWKKGYREPLAFDPDVEKKVNAKWDSLGIRL